MGPGSSFLLDINLPGQDDFVGDATDYASTAATLGLHYGIAGRAADAFRMVAVDCLLKPLDPEQVAKAVNRLLAYLAAWIS